MARESQIMERLKALPPEAQKQVLDFITFLEQRYRRRSN